VADTYDLGTPVGRVRLLLNDVDRDAPVFSDVEVQAFLDLEGGSVKAAAALAIETNADSILLATRVLKTPNLTTDGAKVADSLRARAAQLREQADDDVDGAADGAGLFAVVEAEGFPGPPELTERWRSW
jgi:hypothetical protein